MRLCRSGERQTLQTSADDDDDDDDDQDQDQDQDGKAERISGSMGIQSSFGSITGSTLVARSGTELGAASG